MGRNIRELLIKKVKEKSVRRLDLFLRKKIAVVQQVSSGGSAEVWQRFRQWSCGVLVVFLTVVRGIFGGGPTDNILAV